MAEVIINGPEGRIEARYHRAEALNAPIALVLHPHPQFGGTMNNKVVYRAYQNFVEMGFSVLRFNFRGVGKSQGKYDEGIGELADAAGVLDWLQIQHPDAASCWISGFSFGSWVALQLLMRRPELEGFVAISPPASNFDLTFLSPCPSSGLFLMGDKDDVVAEDAVSAFVNKLSMQPGVKVEYKVIEGADHYYRNHLDLLSDHMREYVIRRLGEMKDRRRIKPDRKRRQLPREAHLS